MKKNLKELNPKLEPGDRIILIYMDDYTNPIPTLSKGVVHDDPETYKLNRPTYLGKGCGYAYAVTWYDDEGNFIGKMPLEPDDDSWIFDKDYYKQ